MTLNALSQQLLFTKPLTPAIIAAATSLNDLIVNADGNIELYHMIDAIVEALIDSGLGQRFERQDTAPVDTSKIWVNNSTTPSTLSSYDGTGWVPATFEDVWDTPSVRDIKHFVGEPNGEIVWGDPNDPATRTVELKAGRQHYDIQKLIEWAEQGGYISVKTPGIYIIPAAGDDAGGIFARLREDTYIDKVQGAIFAAGNGLDNDIMRYFVNPSDYVEGAEPSLYINRFSVNQWGQKTSTSVPFLAEYPASNPGLSATTDGLSVFGQVTVEGVARYGIRNLIVGEFMTDASPTGHWLQSGGDTGFGSIGVLNTDIRQMIGIGSRDVVFYGNALTDPANSHKARLNTGSCIAYGCVGGFTVKRGYSSVDVASITGYNTLTPFSGTTVTEGGKGLRVGGIHSVNGWQVCRLDDYTGTHIDMVTSRNHGALDHEGNPMMLVFSDNNAVTIVNGSSDGYYGTVQNFGNDPAYGNALLVHGVRLRNGPTGLMSSGNVISDILGTYTGSAVIEDAGQADGTEILRNRSDAGLSLDGPNSFDNRDPTIADVSGPIVETGNAGTQELFNVEITPAHLKRGREVYGRGSGTISGATGASLGTATLSINVGLQTILIPAIAAGVDDVFIIDIRLRRQGGGGRRLEGFVVVKGSSYAFRQNLTADFDQAVSFALNVFLSDTTDIIQVDEFSLVRDK